jgi:hypothetical protein
MYPKLPKVHNICKIWQKSQKDVQLNKINKTHIVFNWKQCLTDETTHILIVIKNLKVIKKVEATVKDDRSRKLN